MASTRPQASKSKRGIYKSNSKKRKSRRERVVKVNPDITKGDRGFNVSIGDILLINLEGEGSVQRGARPCVVLHRNESRNLITVVPFTTKKKRKYKNQIVIVDRVLKIPSYALCDNQQTVDKIQVKEKWGKIEKQNFERIVNHLQMIMLENLKRRQGYNKPYRFE